MGTQNHLRVFRETATLRGLNLWGECLDVGFCDMFLLRSSEHWILVPSSKTPKEERKKNLDAPPPPLFKHTHTHTQLKGSTWMPPTTTLSIHTAEALRSE